MGSSMVLAASRQSFAFSRDGALPFSKYLYRMNSYTGTPVNTVWFTAIFSILLGLLAFAGDAAINAIFAMSITALYVGESHHVCREGQSQITRAATSLCHPHRGAVPWE